MEREKINNLINEINKIARLKRMAYKLETIFEEYDEYIEDYYFIEWLRMSQDGITQIEELDNMLELFEQILEELKIAIYNAEDKGLAFLLQKYPKYYEFINLKYLKKKSKDEIEKTLKFDFKKQKIIKDKLLSSCIKMRK